MYMVKVNQGKVRNCKLFQWVLLDWMKAIFWVPFIVEFFCISTNKYLYADLMVFVNCLYGLLYLHADVLQVSL